MTSDANPQPNGPGKFFWLSLLIVLCVVVAPLAAYGIWLLRTAREELAYSHQMKWFALAYHNFYGAKEVGPSNLDELAEVEPKFPNVASKIRDGSIEVVWQAKLTGDVEKNAEYYLAHERETAVKGGWVLRADGRPEKMSADDFKKMLPIPKK